MMRWANQIPGIVEHVSSAVLWTNETDCAQRSLSGVDHGHIT